MADLCNMIPVLTLAANLCISKPICALSEDGTKNLCVSIGQACELPLRAYDCVKEDGAHYRWQEPAKVQ